MYSFDSRVRYSEVDENCILTIPAMLDYLQDCALFHSEHLGHGAYYSHEVGLSWLLSAWEIEIARLPRFTDHVTVSTWATQFKGLFARRNFTIVGDDGFEFVRADSQWFMYDQKAARPIRPPREELEPYDADLANDKPLDMPPLHRQIRVAGEGISQGVPSEPVEVTRAHIDTNHHVNNAQYVAMAFDALPEDLDAHVHRIDVQYREAAVLGDTIYPVVYRFGDPDVETATHGDTGAVSTTTSADGAGTAIACADSDDAHVGGYIVSLENAPAGTKDSQAFAIVRVSL